MITPERIPDWLLKELPPEVTARFGELSIVTLDQALSWLRRASGTSGARAEEDGKTNETRPTPATAPMSAEILKAAQEVVDEAHAAGRLALPADPMEDPELARLLGELRFGALPPQEAPVRPLEGMRPLASLIPEVEHPPSPEVPAEDEEESEGAPDPSDDGHDGEEKHDEKR